MRNTKQNNPKKHKKTVSYSLWNGTNLLLFLAMIANIFFIYELVLLGPIEKVIRYIIIVLFLGIDFLFIKKALQPERKRQILFLSGLALYFLASLFLGYGLYYFNQKLDGLSKDYITYSTSLVTLKESEISSIQEVDELEIGIIRDTSSIEGYIISQDMIQEHKLNEKNTILEYDDYPVMISDLYDGKIDCVFLPGGYVTMFQSIPGLEAIADTTKVILTKEKEMKNNDSLSINQSKTRTVTEPFTILLMGVDSEAEGLSKNAAFNGDSLMLVTFNPKTLSATMLSIPRDSYVPIACFKDQKENKITHAAWYGASCMIKTIENLTGISIDYYAKVNFKAVVHLIDQLGGVDIDVEYSFCEQDSNRKFGNNTIYVRKGFQTLNGEQALAYARNRHAWPAYCSKEWNLGERSDIIRGLHQQAVIEALIGKIKDIRSIDKVLDLFNLVSSNVDTNMTREEILSFYQVGKDILAKAIGNSDEIISIQKLFLKTADQMIYDEGMKLVLADQIINQGSLEDVVHAMKVNLELEQPTLSKSFTFSINDPYEVETIGNRKYPATKLYALLPNFTGKTKAYAEAWGKEHGIRVIFSNSGNGLITSQNYPANKRLDLIPNKTVTFTVANSNTDSSTTTTKIDCSKDTDHDFCSMPNFVGKTKSDVAKWLKNIDGVTIKYNEISVAMANGNKVGTIVKQSISEGTEIKSTKTITLTIVAEEGNESSSGDSSSHDSSKEEDDKTKIDQEEEKSSNSDD